MRRSESEVRRARPDLWWALLLVGVSTVALWRLRPRGVLRASLSGADAQRAGCLSNLGRIGRGFALYSADWDGKFPRGTDAEDHFAPQAWQHARADGTNFFNDVKRAPLLRDLLVSYSVPRNSWHCPADVGWSVSSLPNLSRSALRDVHPSVWQKYGMSYFYLTELGLRGLRAGEIGGNGAGRTLVLFDGEFWHSDDASSSAPRAGVLLADGSARMVEAREFGQLMANWPLN